MQMLGIIISQAGLQWILIYLHTNAGYYNILNKIDFQGADLKVKVTVPTFIDGS